MTAKLYVCNVCGEHVAEGVEVIFVFVVDVESIFICKSCLRKKIKKNSFILRFIPENIKRLLRKYGLYD